MTGNLGKKEGQKKLFVRLKKVVCLQAIFAKNAETKKNE